MQMQYRPTKEPSRRALQKSPLEDLLVDADTVSSLALQGVEGRPREGSVVGRDLKLAFDDGVRRGAPRHLDRARLLHQL